MPRLDTHNVVVGAGAESLPVTGRWEEMAVVLTPVRDAVAGRASTLLIGGEAGVGKTSLVREACHVMADHVDVIWATCLPLTSLTSPLRRAYELAVDLRAQPLLADIERLARGARIDLTGDPGPPPSGIPGLTGREREILGYVMAGRTNAETARALVISEKTVSVHISNMLRKSGAGNRIELAEWAARTALR